MGSTGTFSGTGYKMEDFVIRKEYIKAGRKRSSRARYYIKNSGKTLHLQAAKLTFNTKEQAENFVREVVNGSLTLTDKHRWI